MKLHYQTVSPVLLECLHRLMSHPAFKDFYLVGGTSLALQRGHRLCGERRSVHVDAAQGDSGNDYVDYLYRVHYGVLQGRVVALESFGGFRLLDPCGLFRVYEVTVFYYLFSSF